MCRVNFIFSGFLRPFQDIFLLCFAVDNHVSYGNVRDTWIQEIRHHCPKTPVILVGTKVSRSAHLISAVREQSELKSCRNNLV